MVKLSFSCISDTRIKRADKHRASIYIYGYFMKNVNQNETDTKYFFLILCRCFIEDKSSKVAWLNRSGIIFAGQDKWSLDPRVELEKRSPLEYSLRIQKVDVYDEGSYTCSVQTLHHPKTSQVYLIVQGKKWLLEGEQSFGVDNSLCQRCYEVHLMTRE